MLGPSRLGGASQCLASLLWTDVSPPRSPEAHCLAFYWRRRESSACDIKHFESEINKDLRWQIGLSHDAAQRHAPSNAKIRRQVRRYLWPSAAAGFLY